MTKKTQITLSEQINFDIAHYIKAKWDSLQSQITTRRRDEKYSPKEIFSKYVDRAYKDRVKVDYLQAFGEGRLCARGALSLQNITRQVRHSIARGIYVDLDVKNAHPVILEWLCKKHGINCEKLNLYIRDRERLLKELKCDREVGKNAYLSLTNGGTPDLPHYTQHFIDYMNEMIVIHERLTEIFPKEFEEWKKYKTEKGKTWNFEGSFMNSFLCKYENKILNCIMKYFNIKNGDTAALCFDGIMIPKETPYNLRTIENMIYNILNIRVGVVEKPMNEALDLTGDIPRAPRLTFHGISDYAKLVEMKNVETEILDDFLRATIAYIAGHGEAFFVVKDKKNKWKEGDGDKNLEVGFAKPHKLYDLLDKCIFVDNEDYDPEYREEIKEMSQNKYREECRKMGGKPQVDALIKEYKYGSIKEYLLDCIFNNTHGVYTKVDYYPHLARNPVSSRFYNLFQPYPFDDEKKDVGTERFLQSMWYKHMSEEFFDDEGERDHFFDFLADIVQDPITVKPNAHVFSSGQGTGKGTLTLWLSKILGDTNVCTIADAERFLGSRFNAHYTNKLVRVFEELSDKGSVFRHKNRIKEMITAPTETLEPKGINPTTINHTSRYLFFSNNTDTVAVEADDRRFTLHQIKNTYAQDQTRFSAIYAELKDEEFLRSSFEFLRDRKYEMNNVMKPYETKYKREKKLDHIDTSIQYFIDFCEKFVNGEAKEVIIGKEDFHKQMIIELPYVKTEIKANKLMKNTIVEKLGVKSTRLRHNGGRIRVYQFNPRELEKSLQKYLGMDNYRLEFAEGIAKGGDRQAIYCD